jgi:membrane-associated phospholipid phosphatase
VILTRPNLALGPLPNQSFPSGHATVAFSVGVAATLCVPVEYRRRTAFIAVAYASAIGIATVAAGWHRPSDAAGAMLLVTAIAAVIAAIADIDARSPADAGGPGGFGDAGRYLIAGATALVAGWLVAIAIVLANRAGALEWTLGSAAFFGACAAILSLASVCMAALLWAIRASRPD